MSKLIFTDRQATAIIALLDEGGKVLTLDESKRHYLPAILMDKDSPASSLTEAITFMVSLKQIIQQVQQAAIDNDSLTNKHLRITIELDPSKDFTKPTTDLSTLTITE